MCEVETVLVGDTHFGDFCRLESADGQCAVVKSSIVQFFYEFDSIDDWSCSLLSEGHVEARRDMIYDALGSDDGQVSFGSFVDDGTTDRGYSTRTLSNWNLGGPLAGFSSVGDRSAEQELKYTNFISSNDGSVAGVEEGLFALFDMELNDESEVFKYYPTPYRAVANKRGLTVHWWGRTLNDNEFTRLLNSDQMFSIFSLLFVAVWMRVHTGSSMLTTTGMFMILMSVPVGMMVYKLIFQIHFFSSLHVLVVFIVLGVGADDVFVFVDAWKHSLTESDKVPALEGTELDSEERLYWRMHRTYTHTMKAVFNTSFSTAFAFLATALSPLMPIATFGVFAATCIVINYMFVMTLIPPAVLLSDKFDICYTSYSEQLQRRWDESTGKATVTATAGPDDGAEGGKGDSAAVDMNTKHATHAPAAAHEHRAHEVHGDIMEGADAFTRYYVRFLAYEVGGYRVTALVLIVVMLAYGIFNATQAVKLLPPEEAEKFFPTDHMFTQVGRDVIPKYLTGTEESYPSVDVVFGIKDVDRGNFNRYLPNKNRGKAVFDHSFDLSAPACQRVLVTACEDIGTLTCSRSTCKPLGTVARANSTRCFMTEFRQWADDEHGLDTYAMNSTHFYSMLNTFRVSEVPAADSYANWKNEIGIIDGVLKYVSFNFKATVPYVSSSDDKGTIMRSVDHFMDSVSRSSDCQSSCSCSVFSVSPLWNAYNLEQGLVIGFYQAMSISFPMAFIVLIFATGNIKLALYAITSIFFIVFGVLGFVYSSLGWDLGVAESVAGIIIIGFSVDYTVHLGNEYIVGGKEGFAKRTERFFYASRRIVSTVAAGAMTTGGAGIFMFAAQLIFFTKMATLMVATIVLSYLYALGFFMGYLLVFGPEDEDGNVSTYVEMVTVLVQKGRDEVAKRGEGRVHPVGQDDAVRKVVVVGTGIHVDSTVLVEGEDSR